MLLKQIVPKNEIYKYNPGSSIGTFQCGRGIVGFLVIIIIIIIIIIVVAAAVVIAAAAAVSLVCCPHCIIQILYRITDLKSYSLCLLLWFFLSDCPGP